MGRQYPSNYQDLHLFYSSTLITVCIVQGTAKSSIRFPNLVLPDLLDHSPEYALARLIGNSESCSPVYIEQTVFPRLRKPATVPPSRRQSMNTADFEQLRFWEAWFSTSLTSPFFSKLLHFVHTSPASLLHTLPNKVMFPLSAFAFSSVSPTLPCFLPICIILSY